jgi:hypothetical protein
MATRSTQCRQLGSATHLDAARADRETEAMVEDLAPGAVLDVRVGNRTSDQTLNALVLAGDGDERAAVLVLRKTQAPRAGAEVEAWLLEAPREGIPLQVTIDDFGRLPISDTMRPRYTGAIERVLQLLDGVSAPKSSADALSEVKGMFNRVLRRDQRDWATVSALLGHPTHERCRRWAGALAETRSSLQDGRYDIADALRDAELRARLLQARRVLTEGGRPHQNPPRRRRASAVRPPVGSRSSVAPSNWVRSARTQARYERATRTHEGVRLALALELENRGFLVWEDQLVDLYAELPSATALYEVKSITPDNWRSQVRKGVAQLKEYRFLQALPGAPLYLVLSQPPPEDWVLELLAVEYGIGVLWNTEHGFAGPSARSALGG